MYLLYVHVGKDHYYLLPRPCMWLYVVQNANLFIHMTWQQKKQANTRVEISILKSYSTNRMHANGVLICACLYLYLDACTPSTQSRSFSAKYCMEIRRGKNYHNTLLYIISVVTQKYGHIYLTQDKHIQMCIKHNRSSRSEATTW